MAPSIPTTMKAWQFSQTTGGVEKNLKLNNAAPLPPSANSLAADQVLVQVLSSSLNPVDYKFAEMPVLGNLIIKRPSSPAIDFSGRVVASGPNSKKASSEDLKPGQLVFGRLESPTKFGTLAEYTVVPTSGCVPLPQGINADDAACIGTAALTAYQCIVPNVKSGDRVFINGGSGGVGSFGIQLAKVKGCYVATTCSSVNVELCKSLGADEVIDYKSKDVVAELKKLQKFDLVVDNVGTPSEMYWEAHDFTKEGTKYVQVGGGVSMGDIYRLLSRMMWPGFLGGGKRSFIFLGLANNYDHFKEIGEWMAQGKVKALIDEVYGMEDKGPIKAFERLRTGRAKGKIVVRVAEP
ncbi:hypothetical protein IMSHALPRED_010119 [Imshaugia aleurites]|uniref:Enoyl reductase (ER) domain-containing protein n=1 Tax=Imshaugia aleurites TaxID=172621 RepID=A0A8H3G1W2_9LECA|nr:hypothetical protein IMSHALPRED_010119 [Imshaugia aleurites]